MGAEALITLMVVAAVGTCAFASLGGGFGNSIADGAQPQTHDQRIVTAVQAGIGAAAKAATSTGAAMARAAEQGAAWTRALDTHVAYPFAVRESHSLAELPQVLDAAARLRTEASALAPHAPLSVPLPGLRGLAESTLDVMHERMRGRLIQIDRGERGALLTADHADVLRERIHGTQSHIERAQSADALSFDEFHDVVFHYLAGTENTPRRDPTAAGLGVYRQALSGHWFPRLSNQAFWSYDQVWDWRHVLPDMFPLEIPMGAKDVYEKPSFFFVHDSGHADLVRSRLTSTPRISAEWKRLVSAADAAQAHGGLPADLKLLLGHYTWEYPNLLVDNLVRDPGIAQRGVAPMFESLAVTYPNGMPLSDRTRSLLTQWRTQWAKEDAHAAH